MNDSRAPIGVKLMPKQREVPVGRRVMDVAWMRDGSNIYTGEALLLALLLRAKSHLTRGSSDAKLVGKLLDDPNQ